MGLYQVLCCPGSVMGCWVGLLGDDGRCFYLMEGRYVRIISKGKGNYFPSKIIEKIL